MILINKDLRILAHNMALMCSMSYLDPEGFEEALPHANFDIKGYEFLSANGTQLYIIETDKNIIVCFRGTQVTANWSWTDIIRNFKSHKVDAPSGGKVHQGYYQGAREIMGQLNIALAQEKYKGKAVVFTGHSLGGSTATAARLMVRTPPFVTITFGAPKVGDRKYVNSQTHVKLIRFVHARDIAPRFPSFVRGFKQSKEFYKIDRKGFTTLKKTRWWDTTLIPGSTPIGVLDHRIGEYIEKLGAVQR